MGREPLIFAVGFKRGRGFERSGVIAPATDFSLSCLIPGSTHRYELVAGLYFWRNDVNLDSGGHYTSIGRVDATKFRVHDNLKQFILPVDSALGYNAANVVMLFYSREVLNSRSVDVRGSTWMKNNCFQTSLLTCLAYVTAHQAI
jgi:hypothetical protein